MSNEQEVVITSDEPLINFEEDTKEAIEVINQCLQKIGERLNAIEQFIQQIPTPDKVMYKPEGQKDYLNMKENYDLIYDRLKKLEGE